MALEALTRLSDVELVRELRELVAAKGRTDARFVAHLAEVEQRRLHLETGFSSLFDYCLRGLGLSENEAFHRITAARLGRRFPLLLELLDARALTLSAACLLRDYLTDDNHAELLIAASHKSKREVELELAARFPGVSARSSVRKLPQRAVPLLAKSSNAATATAVAGVAPMPLFRVQFDASAELAAKLERASALLSHGNPRGDLAVTVERAVDLLLDRLEMERFGKTQRPRTAATPRTSVAAEPTSAATAMPKLRRRKRIANEVRRIVAARDGGCCSFVSADGQRCGAHAFLQLHHEQPWARGGSDEAANLRLLCAAHNRLLAERDFGSERIGSWRE